MSQTKQPSQIPGQFTDALQAALDQGFQEAGPEGFGLGRPDAEPDDLAASIGIGCHGDYCSDGDDAPALTHFEIGGIEPEIGPLAFDRAGKEGVHALVDIFAQLRHPRFRGDRLWLFEMPASPMACTRSSTRRVETPPIQASWMTATSGFSVVFRASRKGGK